MSELDPRAQAILDAGKASGLPPVYTLPVEQSRQRMRAAFIKPNTILDSTVKELSVPGPAGGIPLRLYTPGAPRQDRALILFFHGGGWTVNDIDTHDVLCDLLATETDAVVLSVGFRLGPENRYPAAVDDAYAAFRWALDNYAQIGTDGVTVAVAGDSSGGNIAAALTLVAQHRKAPRIQAQFLLYPALDHLNRGTASYVERANGYSLNKDFMAWSWANYLPDSWADNDPYLFPLQAPDLHGLPTALVMTAEFDPLRDEGQLYAERLQCAGVEVLTWHLDDQMHGFAMQTKSIPHADVAVREAAAALKKYLQQQHNQNFAK
jgi:acetyl esterase